MYNCYFREKMFSIDKNEYALENVARTVKYECFRRGFDYKEDEIKFLAILEISNPLGEFNGTHSNLDPELNRLIDLCIDFLCDQELNCSIKTIIVQSYFTKWYTSKETVAKNYRDLIRVHTNPLVTDICRSEPLDGLEHQNLYRKIVLAMLLLSGIGDATKKQYIVAAEVALKSIFPIKNLEGFINLSYHNKLKELNDLKKTIAGIILYNEFKLKYTFTINQQSTLLEEGSIVVLSKLCRSADCLDSLAEVLTSAIQETVHFDAEDKKLMVVESNPIIDNNSIPAIKYYLLLLQQCRRSIRYLVEDAKDSQQEFYKHENNSQYLIRGLLNKLRGKVAISINKVYTKFQEIGDTWNREQELCVIFSSINDTHNAVMTLSEVHRMPLCVRKVMKCEGLESVDLEELVSQVRLTPDFSSYIYEPINPLLVDCEVIEESDFSGDNKLEYNGFCPVYCVESNGFLVDARKEIGFLLFKEKFYGFRDNLAAYIFGQDPNKYIEKVIDFVRTNVEYIDILNLSKEVVTYRGMKIWSDNGITVKPRKPTRDKEIQTDVHPIETYIDKEYSWNIWEYRRRAVKLADIVSSATKSSQSYSSHFRESSGVQTHSPRERPSQTMRDFSTLTDTMEADTWCIRGRNPHSRKKITDCQPGVKKTNYCSE